MALRAFSALSPEKEAQDPNGSTYGPGVMEYLGCKMWCVHPSTPTLTLSSFVDTPQPALPCFRVLFLSK